MPDEKIQNNDQDDEFAAEFNREDGADDSADAADAAGAADAATAPAPAPAAPAQSNDAAAALATKVEDQQGDTNANANQALMQRLQDMETRLQAKQAELDRREAAMAQSNPKDSQGENPGKADGAGADDDPASVLARDFGEDFVKLVTDLVMQLCTEQVTKGVGSVAATVDQLIQQLSSERQANHFKAIAAAHGDFMEVVEAPEFMAWKAAQPPAQQKDIGRVITSGSAQEIIDMLTRFKQAKAGSNKAGNADSHDDALDAAEGVRSSGIKLPNAPTPADDFAAAWNEA